MTSTSSIQVCASDPTSANLLHAVVFSDPADAEDGSDLAQAEWIKFAALFYNREAEATAIFDGMVSR